MDSVLEKNNLGSRHGLNFTKVTGRRTRKKEKKKAETRSKTRSRSTPVATHKVEATKGCATVGRSILASKYSGVLLPCSRFDVITL